MSYSNVLPNTPKFSESETLVGADSWRSFKTRVELVVKARGLIGYLNGSTTRPLSNPTPTAITVTDANGNTTTSTPTHLPPTPAFSSSPSVEEWDMRDRGVVDIIVSNTQDPDGVGIDASKTAKEIWAALTTHFEDKSEQLIYHADRKLRTHQFDPSVEEMEDHEANLRKLRKRFIDLGGKIEDTQFRQIVINSVPLDWKSDMRNVPGTTPDEAFRHLHSIWFDKVDETQRKDKEYQKAKALLASEIDQLTLEKARSIVAAAAQSPSTASRRLCTNPNCPRKVGHTMANCWAKGGGAEGKGPPSYVKKYGTATSANPVVVALANGINSSLETHHLDPSDSSHDGASTTAASASSSDPSPTRQSNPVLGGGEASASGGVDTHSVESFSCCCYKVFTPLYSPVPEVKTFLDSGASEHIWRLRGDFTRFLALKDTRGTGASAGFDILGIGDVEFTTRAGGNDRIIRLTNVRYAPTVQFNLISIPTLDGKGFSGTWGNNVFTVCSPGSNEVVMQGVGRAKMYEIDKRDSVVANYARSTTKTTDILTWHRRLAHVSIPRILRMANRNLVNGLDISSKTVSGMCEDCLYAKATKRPFDEVLEHEADVLERVHLDLWGPARTKSQGGAVYMALYTDGRSSVRIPYFLPNKLASTTLKSLHDFRVLAERQTGKRLKIIRVDHGREFDNELVREYCTSNGIVIEFNTPYSSAANGVAERANRTVIEGVRAFLEESGLPPSFWAEAAATFCYVDGFVPSSRFPDDIPVEVWSRKRQDISHLRPFGCDCWATLPERRTDGKLSCQAVKGKLVGYLGRRGYKIWVPETQ
jgi:transposase InsO family protein